MCIGAWHCLFWDQVCRAEKVKTPHIDHKGQYLVCGSRVLVHFPACHVDMRCRHDILPPERWSCPHDLYLRPLDHLSVSPRACRSLIGRQCQVSPENDYDLTVGVTIALWAIPQHGLTRWGRRELHQSHSTIYIYFCTHTWCALVHDIVCFETRSAEQRRSRHLILTIKANIWCVVVECWYIFQHVMLTWDADMTFWISFVTFIKCVWILW